MTDEPLLEFYRFDKDKVETAFRQNDVNNFLVNKIINTILDKEKDPISALAEARAYANMIQAKKKETTVSTPQF